MSQEQNGPEEVVIGGPPKDPKSVAERLKSLDDGSSRSFTPTSRRRSVTSAAEPAPERPAGMGNLPKAGGGSLAVSQMLRRKVPEAQAPARDEATAQTAQEPLHDAAAIADQLAHSLRAALAPDVLKALKESL